MFTIIYSPEPIVLKGAFRTKLRNGSGDISRSRRHHSTAHDRALGKEKKTKIHKKRLFLYSQSHISCVTNTCESWETEQQWQPTEKRSEGRSASWSRRSFQGRKRRRMQLPAADRLDEERPNCLPKDTHRMVRFPASLNETSPWRLECHLMDRAKKGDPTVPVDYCSSRCLKVNTSSLDVWHTDTGISLFKIHSFSPQDDSSYYL